MVADLAGLIVPWCLGVLVECGALVMGERVPSYGRALEDSGSLTLVFRSSSTRQCARLV